MPSAYKIRRSGFEDGYLIAVSNLSARGEDGLAEDLLTEGGFKKSDVWPSKLKKRGFSDFDIENLRNLKP